MSEDLIKVTQHHAGQRLAPEEGLSHEESLWRRLRTDFRTEIGESDYSSWIQPLFLFSATGDRITLAAPSRFVRDWVQSNYLEALLTQWRALSPKILLVEIIVRAPQRVSHATGLRPTATPVASVQLVDRDTAPENDSSIEKLASPLDPTHTLADFVVAPPNELAVAAVKRVIEDGGPSFNPLVLYGGVGLGKTHLLQALAWGIRGQNPGQTPNRRVAYISAEKFLYSFVRSIRSRNTEQFKNAMRDLDVLLIDDMQYISSGEATQEEFVQTFNTLFDRNKQVVVATNKPPAQLTQLDERLRSRLMGGLAIDLQPTTEDLRLTVLKKKALVASGLIPDEVLSWVAEKIPSNIREIEGALNRLIAHASLLNKPVSMDFAKTVLRDLVSANEKRVGITEIQRQVAGHFEIRQSDMVSQRRARQVARPRQIAMYLSKQMTNRSLPDIGRSFGGRDHTTVMHAIKRVEELRETDGQLRQDLESLQRVLES